MPRFLRVVALVVAAIIAGGVASGIARIVGLATPSGQIEADERSSAAQDDSIIRFATVARIEMSDVAGVVAKDGLAYVTEAAFGLHVYDMHDPAAPVEIGRAATVGDAGRVVVDGHVALVALGQGSVGLFDLSNLASLPRLGTLRLGQPQQALAASDGVGLVADGSDLVAFDYATPNAPHEVGRLELDYFGPRAIALPGKLAYVAQHYDRLRVVDIADPTHPMARGSLGGDGASGQFVAVDGSRAYVGERLPGYYFVPTPVPPTPGPSPTGGTLTATPSATEPPDGGRLTVVDVSDPDAPQALGSSVAFPYAPIDVVRADGQLVWMVTGPDIGRRELMVMDVSDPAYPVLASVAFDPPLRWDLQPLDVSVDGDVVYVAAEKELRILRRVRGGSDPPAYLPFLAKGLPAPPIAASP